MEPGWTVYLMTNRRRSAIYCGMTEDLHYEVKLHRTRRAQHLVGKRHLTHVLWRETYLTESEARAKCMQIRKWTRPKKEAFIQTVNPEYECILAAQRRLTGDRPRPFNWRKLANKGEVGPDGPTELTR